MCGDCRKKCTPGLTSKELKTMGVYEIEENMKIVAENRRLYSEEFETTREFFTGARRDKPVIYADETHGWWIDATEAEPYLLKLDDIISYNMRLVTRYLDEDERRNRGFLDWLFAPDFYSEYPELPRCHYDEKITGMYFDVRLRSNELGLEKVEIDVFPGLFTSESDVRGAYACCHELYMFLGDRQSRAFASFEDDAPQNNTTVESLEALEKLHSLLKSGVITQEEFDAKKKQILGL
ncbi:MAG: SHOCT domain-containing protein [Clostridia bacterium]|nr:SHOCT domain-containing protein [Clostridia bacterium]